MSPANKFHLEQTEKIQRKQYAFFPLTIMTKICFSVRLNDPDVIQHVQKHLLHYLVSSSCKGIIIGKCRVLVYGSPEVQYCNDCLLLEGDFSLSLNRL